MFYYVTVDNQRFTLKMIFLKNSIFNSIKYIEVMRLHISKLG